MSVADMSGNKPDLASWRRESSYISQPGQLSGPQDG
jgi:hypothetical protein